MKKPYLAILISILIIYITHKPILESFIENKLEDKFAKDLSIRNLSFENSFISFDIFIEEKRGVEFFGNVDIFSLEADFKYRVLKGSLNWFKKDIPKNMIFSGNGNLFISPKIFQIDGDLKSDKERTIFNYKRVEEDITAELYLKDLQTYTLKKLFDLKFFGNKIDLNATFYGDTKGLKSEDSKFEIDGNNFNGELQYLFDSIIFSGKSSFIDKQTEFSIGRDENILNFEKAPIGFILQKIFQEKLFYGRGKFSVSEIDKDHLKFSGSYETVAIEERSLIEFLNLVFDFGFYDIPLQDVQFKGELKKENFTFSMAGVTKKLFFKIENASISLKDQSGTIPITLFSDESIGEFLIDLEKKTVFTKLSDLGLDKFGSFIYKQENQEMLDIFKYIDFE